MKNPSGKKLEKLVFGLFDQMVESADKYVTKEGSTWLIFTEEKRWVVEFTKDKTLWFNYNQFQSELELIGKDCTEEKDLIKNWFESRFLGIKPVEDTIQNGVRHTLPNQSFLWSLVKDTIQNGVRHTYIDNSNQGWRVEDTIQNGVRHTEVDGMRIRRGVKDAIQEGVKETTPSGYLGSIEMKGKIIHQIETPKQNNEVEDTIQNGVKNTEWYSGNSYGEVEETIQNGVKHTQGLHFDLQGTVEDTIQNGVKHTFGVEFRTSSTVENTIQNGVRQIFISKNTPIGRVEDTIQNGVRHVKDGDWLDQDDRIEEIIQN